MRSQSFFPVIIFIIIFGIGLLWANSAYKVSDTSEGTIIGIGSFFVALLISMAIKIADPWSRAIVLRLGRFQSLRGPGLFLIVPIIDTIPYWIDIRVIATSFKAEKTLTKDTVPVDVDAVLFWKVLDPKRLPLK